MSTTTKLCGCVVEWFYKGQSGLCILYCPVHKAGPVLLAALKATLTTLEEAAAIIVADPGHSVGQAAQIEMIRRKAEATIVEAD